MPVVNLSTSNSLVNQFLSEIRDAGIQQDSMRFRKNMERCGEILAYEISKVLPYRETPVGTPLGIATVPVLETQPVLGAILRAGIMLHQGMLNFFDKAGNAFIAAYRKHNPDGSFEIELEYLSCPNLENRILIIADPMLATGQSMVKTLEQIFATGQPRHTHLACVIAAQPGIDRVLQHIPNVTIWACAVDTQLDARSYIVPGLGDAGDLSYGTKMQY
ncbi:MAG: uracil phosphoribosyltransferase [Chitinophagaceae bacterium]|nr:uracil phosphoribosyltransferase [Chitinophagaceae bacterium]